MTRGWAWWGFAGLCTLNGVRLRRRARGLATLPESDATGAGEAAWVWRRASGCELDAGARARIERYAARRGLDVVEVVPGDLSVERCYDLLRAVAPGYRHARLAPGVGALHAAAARRDVAARSGLAGAEDLDPLEMERTARSWKLHAAATTDLVVDRSLVAGRVDHAARQAVLQERFGGAWWLAVAVPLGQVGALGLGLAVSPVAGGVALAAWSLQPVVALAGTALRPRDLWWRSLVRAPAAVADAARGAMCARRSGPRARTECESLRPVYDGLLAGGTERFFEPRRSDCPLCGSSDLRVQVRTADLLQGKPGRFTLERCGGCRHVFQNPRLSPEGLEFYYRDFYDGLGQGRMELLARWRPASFRERALELGESARPSRWLDVGAGYGHFCIEAAALWPGVNFDGLDMGESIEEAERRRWVRHGYRAVFPDVAQEVAGRYDVVSMFHYLEHARDPRAELAAAARALAPGGHVLIEVPDPDSGFGRLLGRYWLSWFQPQHLHLLPLGAMCRELRRAGFEVVSVSRTVQRFPVDLPSAVVIGLGLAPLPEMPWRPRPTRRDRRRRGAATVLAAPLVLLAVIADLALRPLHPPAWRSTAYRVVARKPVVQGQGQGQGQEAAVPVPVQAQTKVPGTPRRRRSGAPPARMGEPVVPDRPDGPAASGVGAQERSVGSWTTQRSSAPCP